MTDQNACSYLSTRHESVYAIGSLWVRIFLIFLFLPCLSFGQNEPEYDEISVFFNVQRFGGTDITALIKNETVYLPIADVFSFLKVKNNISSNLDSVSGFFINQQAVYLIDKPHNRIVFQGKTFDLKQDELIRTETNLYLKSNYFGQVFGLECTFSFRSLAVTLNTKLELPVIREMRLEQMRSNINRLKGETKADTTISQSHPAFALGMADWSVIATQQQKGQSDARINLTLGSMIAGGEASASLNYNNNTPFNEKEQFYLWRYVNNDNAALRQMMAGKISSQTTSSIFNPIVGVQFTNTPTTYRRSFGTYTLSDVTEPNWIVELYVNSVLVDYVKADASGFYKFEVPLVYGNSAVMLRFYGPWGEERTKEENISIPFNFLPANEFEYSISAGIVEDTLNSRFSRATVNYGLSKRMTIGGGIEYLSSVTTGTTMPFLNTSIRLASSLLVTAEYTYGVLYKGILSYRLPSNMQFELDYAHYQKGQKAIIYNYLEERKAVISLPIKAANFAAFTRLTLNQIIMENLKNTNAELLLSGSVYGVSTNFTTYGLFTDPSNPYIYSNLSLAFRLPKKITFTPQIQYEYVLNDFIATKFNLEKPLFKNGFLNVSYEQNFKSNITNIEVGLRYDFPYAQTGFSARLSNDVSSFVQSARGSLMYDHKTKYFGANNRTSVGKGGIIFLPFLDLNCNGHRDPDEPKVAGLNLRIDGGRIEKSDKDTTIRVFDLIPYTSYFVELNKNSFENIAWQIRKLTMNITVDPNRFKVIEVPIAVVGEASGTVYFKGIREKRGQGQILINFYRNDSTLAARTMSEADGYFSFLGLAPGPYTARIDTVQLNKIHMTSTPSRIPITVKHTKDGDVIDGLEFTLQSNVKDTSNINSPSIEKKLVPTQKNIKDSVNIHAPSIEKKLAPTQKNVKDSSIEKKLVPTPKDVNSVNIHVPPIEKKLAPKPKNGKDSANIHAPSIEKKLVPTQKKVKDTANIHAPSIELKLAHIPAKKDTSDKSQTSSLSIKKEGLDKQLTQEKIRDTTKKIFPSIKLKSVPAAAPKVVVKNTNRFGSAKKSNKQGVALTPKNAKLSSAQKPTEQVEELHPTGSVVQVGAFLDEANAKAAKNRLTSVLGRKCIIVAESGFFKVQIPGFSNRIDAASFLPKIVSAGFEDAFVVVQHK